MSATERGAGALSSAAEGQPSVLFVNQHYWPDIASTGQHLTDLAEYLAEAGFEVEVITGRARYDGGELEAPRRERRNGVEIRRLRTTGFGRDSWAGRIVDYASFFVLTALRLLFGRRSDAVVFLTTPPLLPVLGPLVRVLRGQRYGVWSMDLHPDAEEALRVFEPGGVVATLLHALNDPSHRRADFVVDLGPFMKRRLEEKGVPETRLTTIPVWNRKEFIEPVPDPENPLVEELGLEDRFVVMYSGNAGLGHRFEEVLEAVDRLDGSGRFFFLFVGDGPRRSEIERYLSENQIRNAAYLDYFPREKLRYSLSLGDLHLVTLRDEMGGVAAPGKIYGILAVARPTLFVGPVESEPAHVIEKHSVGTVIDPGRDAEPVVTMVDTIREYADNPEETGSIGDRARQVFLDHYERDVCCEQWRELLERELSSGPR